MLKVSRRFPHKAHIMDLNIDWMCTVTQIPFEETAITVYCPSFPFPPLSSWFLHVLLYSEHANPLIFFQLQLFLVLLIF